MDFKTNILLITGPNGWLGLNLVHALRNGIKGREDLGRLDPRVKIRCVVLPGEDISVLQRIDAEIDVVEGDLASPETCQRLCEGAKGATLIHTAGLVHPKRIADLYHSNLETTKALLAAAREAGVRRAVVVSSNSPCGCNPTRDHLFTEESPYNPYMNYGRVKMLMERHVTQVQQSGGLETVIVRPCWFYGPYQPPRQTLFFEMIRDGKAPIVGDGNNLRSMSYTENTSQGLILCGLLEQANGQTYWIADERPYTMNKITDTVERLLETEFGQKCVHKRLRLPGLVSEAALAVDRAHQAVGLYNQKIHVLSEMNKNIACSVEKAKRELGYQPTVALEEGMRRSLLSLGWSRTERRTCRL